MIVLHRVQRSVKKVVRPTTTARRAWLSGGLSMLGGETVALDQGWGIEILMSKKIVVQIWIKFVAYFVRLSGQSFVRNLNW